ncbi:hypothetical protein ACGYWM_30955, partial [Burkholderia pseudomallei]
MLSASQPADTPSATAAGRANGAGTTLAATSSSSAATCAKNWVHRRKPWSLGERLRNLTPDF